jgi:hypothetical protein
MITSQSYYNKMAILCIATLANVFIMWYFLIRPEGADWVSSQVLHQTSPYVVNAAENGWVKVKNPLVGYEVALPPGLTTAGARNLTFFLEDGKRRRCGIKHYYIRADKTRERATTSEELVVPLMDVELIFKLIGPAVERTNCAKYLKQIKAYIASD